MNTGAITGELIVWGIVAFFGYRLIRSLLNHPIMLMLLVVGTVVVVLKTYNGWTWETTFWTAGGIIAALILLVFLAAAFRKSGR